MATTLNPFSITYGTLTVGGASTTLHLNGPYVIDRSFPKLRLVFDVVVVATSQEQLQTLATSVETEFTKRDKSVTIDIGGDNPWVYTFGSGILNTTASCTKSGNRDTDHGFSRAYTCVVEGSMPAADQVGLSDVEVNVDISPSRQKTVTMKGSYTALAGDSAIQTYQSEFDGRASALLTSIDSTATWELVSESSSQDRNNHTAAFVRQYLELLAEQSAGLLDDPQIRDHRVAFTDLSQYPGDSQQNVQRFRRVNATYDCAVDIDQTTDLDTVFANKVMPHLIALFVANFNPRVYGVEERSIGFDRTGSRISCSVRFIYQKGDSSEDLVQVAESVTLRDTRTIDYTPVHDGGELSAYADTGWIVRERTYQRNALALGSIPSGSGSRSGVGRTDGGGGDAVGSGWNTIQATQQSSVQWIGDPEFGQIQVFTLDETVVQRFSETPRGSGGGGGGGWLGSRPTSWWTSQQQQSPGGPG